MRTCVIRLSARWIGMGCMNMRQRMFQRYAPLPTLRKEVPYMYFTSPKFKLILCRDDWDMPKPRLIYFPAIPRGHEWVSAHDSAGAWLCIIQATYINKDREWGVNVSRCVVRNEYAGDVGTGTDGYGLDSFGWSHDIRNPKPFCITNSAPIPPEFAREKPRAIINLLLVLREPLISRLHCKYADFAPQRQLQPTTNEQVEKECRPVRSPPSIGISLSYLACRASIIATVKSSRQNII